MTAMLLSRVLDRPAPELSAGAERYIELAHNWVQADLQDPARPGAADYAKYVQGLEGAVVFASHMDTMVAGKLAWDFLGIMKDYPDHDFKNLGKGFIKRTDDLHDVMQTGRRLGRWAAKHGKEALVEVDRPYSPLVVALGGAWAVEQMFNAQKGRQWRRLMNNFRVPDFQRS